MQEIEIDTPHGPARAQLDDVADPADPRATLVMSHGAGGGVGAVDLGAAAGAARAGGVSVILIEQPYRVAGRKAPAPPKQLDAAWLAVIAGLRERGMIGNRLIAGGRSMSARVACRTAAEADAMAVLCLAFPVHPPGKADDPTKSRQGELDEVSVPVLVIQGESDPFGMPPGGPGREVVTVTGNHSLKAGIADVGPAVERWLGALLG